ncbi:MAG: ABC transporter permease, partial [Bacteroidota bacterium]
MFHLDHALAAWRHSLRHDGALGPDDLDELERHLRDHIAALTAQGVPAERAFREAIEALGPRGALTGEYQKVYWRKQHRRGQLGEALALRRDLLQNHLTLALRTLVKEKGYAAINIAGLAVAVAACLLILSFVRYERSYDQFHEGRADLYVIGEGLTSPSEVYHFHTRGALGPVLATELAGVERAVRLSPEQAWVRSTGQRVQEPVLLADSAFFDLFTVRLLAGRPQDALRLPEGVVLSASAAERHFGRREVLGEVLEVDFEERTVTGVFEDFPATSTLQGDLLLPFIAEEGGWINWDNTTTPTYVRLHAGADPVAVAEQIQALVAERSTPGRWTGESYTLLPFAEAHLQRTANGLWTPGTYPGLTMLGVLLAIGAAIAVIAAINVTNLSTARALSRTREVGVRKVLGAYPKQLRWQFLGEALLLSYLAAALGGGLAVLARPVFNDLLGTEITLGFTQDPVTWLLLLGLGTGVGLLAGSYPAFLLARFEPAVSLRGRLAHSPQGGRLRQGLVVVQFALSMALIFGTLVMAQQVRHMKTQDLRFDAEGVVVIPLNPSAFEDREAATAQIGTIKAALAQHPRIAAVSASQSVPGNYVQFGFDFTIEGQSDRVHTRWTTVDDAYFSLYDIDVVEGRGFSADRPSESGRTAVINEAARQAFGWEDGAVGKTLRWEAGGDPYEVVGVVEDFHFESLASSIYPVVHFYVGQSSAQYNMLSLQVTPGPLPPVLDFVQQQAAALDPTWPFSYRFADEQFDQL